MPGLLTGFYAALVVHAAAVDGAVPTRTPSSPAGMLAPSAPAGLPAGNLFVEQDTPIRLMVLNEVSTKTAKPGDRFVLRVDEDVVVDGVTIIPVGSRAWGEVVDATRSGSIGKSGKLQARLLHVEVGDAQIPISGENKSAGEGGGSAVILGAFGLGPLALLAPGNNAKLKAGEIFSAYFDADLAFDPTTSRLSLLPAAAVE